METDKILNEKILAITMLIKKEHPELLPFIGEMTETIPDDKNPDINGKMLKEYCDSLESLLKRYSISHPY